MSGTPAETLRRAAKLMRERAEAATPGPWFTRGDGDWYVCSNAFGLVSTGIHDEPGMGHLVNIERDGRDAEHVASWHPGTALAVARWLESLDGIEWSEHAAATEELTHALKIARAYLGEGAA